MLRGTAARHPGDGPAPVMPTAGPVAPHRRQLNARPPVVPGFAVRRHRLEALLDVAVQRRVTVVVAPPGYGKTVLVSQWAAAHRRRRVRWLTLGPEHDDGARLARDLRGALGTPAPAAGTAAVSALDGSDGASGPGLLAGIRTDLRSAPPTVLVLDDVQRLSDRAVFDELASLFEHLPRWMHVALLTRVDPPFHLHRLRLADELVELRQDDLSFRSGEAAELVRRLSDRELTGAQLDALVARTEGWAVGLHLAAVSLREQDDVGRFVATFADDDRNVPDYLTEQVLNQQPDDVRQFMLSTCVLERMSGPLCDAVTGGVGAQAMLDELDRRSLFVSPLDPRREWFRYHQLFRSLLRHHLRDDDPDRARLLLERAAAWHLDRHELEIGVDYLAQAGAWSSVLEAAFTFGGGLLVRGGAAAVARWIERVPPAARHGNARATLLHAAASIVAGDTRTADDELDGIGALGTVSAAERVLVDLLRARSALRQGAAVPAMAAAARVARDVVSVEEADVPNLPGLLTTREDVCAAAQVTRGAGLLLVGDVAAARAVLGAVLDRGNAVWQVQALGALALAETWSGQLTSAEQHAARALVSAEDLGLGQQLLVADAHLALAAVARERDDLGWAGTLLDEITGRPMSGRHPVLEALVVIEQALLALAAGRPADGLAMLGRHGPHAARPDPPAVDARRRAVEARLRSMIGDVEGAQRVLDAGPGTSLDLRAEAVKLAIERGDVATARALVAHWPDGPEPRAGPGRELWLAVLDHLDGGDTTAGDRFAAVVAQAEPEGNLGLFRAAGRHVLGPARALYRADPSPFLRAILDPPGTAAARSPGRGSRLVEPLTERESVLLALLPTRMSNDEIARRLGVSINTVKTHIKHIYRKLEVAGRGEAVAVAERMHLI